MSENVAKNFAAILRELQSVQEGLHHSSIDDFLSRIIESTGIFLAGAGRSGLMIRAFAMRLRHLGLAVHLTGGLLAPPIQPGQLLIMASGSGETASIVAMGRKAKDLGASLALITANASSTLAAMSDSVIVLEAPASKATFVPPASSIQPMGSLFEQAMFLFCEAAVMELMRNTEQDAGAMFRRHANLE